MSIMSFLLPLLGALVHWRVPRIVLGIILVQAIGVAIQAMLCVRVFPVLRRPRLDLGTLRQLLSFGGWVAVSGAVGPVLVYADRIAIGVLLSITAVGQYTPVSEVVTRISIIPMSLAAVLFPLFSSGRLAGPDLETVAVRSLKALAVVMGLITLLIVALAEDIVGIWLGNTFQPVVTVPLQILAVGMFVNSLAYIPYSLLQGLGRPDVTGKLHLIELPVHLALVSLLVAWLGLIGAALAWSTRVSIDAALLFRAAARSGHLRYPSLRSSGLVSILKAGALLALTAVGISAVPNFSLRLVALMMTVGTAGLLLLPPRQRGARADALLHR